MYKKCYTLLFYPNRHKINNRLLTNALLKRYSEDVRHVLFRSIFLRSAAQCSNDRRRLLNANEKTEIPPLPAMPILTLYLPIDQSVKRTFDGHTGENVKILASLSKTVYIYVCQSKSFLV